MSLLIEFSRHIPAPPEAVFDAWLDPKAMAVFLRPAPPVRTVNISVDAKVGGLFSLTMMAGETPIPIHGEYRELERPHRLSFTWLSGRTLDNSLVSLTFEPAPGGTTLTLRHTGFPDASSRDDHDGGWQGITNALAALLAHG